MFDFIRDFCEVLGKIVNEEKYTQYSRETKGAGLYYKIEKSVFEEYVNKFSDYDLKDFIGNGIDYGFIKSEKTRSRRCVYSIGNMRFYFVNKVFVDAALKNTDGCQK